MNPALAENPLSSCVMKVQDKNGNKRAELDVKKKEISEAEIKVKTAKEDLAKLVEITTGVIIS